MPIGFLQDHYADDLLTRLATPGTMWWSRDAAVEIAMLGFPEDANAILHVLNEYGHFNPADAGFVFKCIWFHAGLSPPDVNDVSEGAVWITSEQEMRKDELEARQHIYPLPDWVDWSRVDAEMLEKMQQEIENPDVGPFGRGLTESRRIAAYAAVVAMASDLDRSDVVARVMPDMVRYIHNYQPWSFLRLIPTVWKEYLLNGWLREKLNLTKEDVQLYARYVLESTRERLENGPRRPADLYHDLTTAQLIDTIDRNTIIDPRFKQFVIDMRIKTSEYYHSDPGPGNTNGLSAEDQHAAWEVAWHEAQEKPYPLSIMHRPATSEQIAETEKRIGLSLPDDIKEFFMLTNGCYPVRSDGWLRLRLPSLDQIFFEKDGYMDDYRFQVVPRLHLAIEIDWPGFPDGAIAMYEHDGQGTRYVWIVGADSIRESKEQLRIAYEKASDQDKATVDSHINYFYGSREAYDAMTDHCYYEVHWGEGARAIHPDFRSYLASVAAQSRHHVDRSPLKRNEDK